MTVSALIHGTLAKPPESRTSRQGNPFAMATMRVASGNESQYWRIFVFSESAQAELMRLGEGDALACQGVPKFEIYTPDGGAARVSLSLTTDSILPLRQPPRERKKKEQAAETTAAFPLDRNPPRQRDRSDMNRHGDAGEDVFGDKIPF